MHMKRAYDSYIGYARESDLGCSGELCKRKSAPPNLEGEAERKKERQREKTQRKEDQ